MHLNKIAESVYVFANSASEGLFIKPLIYLQGFFEKQKSGLRDGEKATRVEETCTYTAPQGRHYKNTL